MKRFDDSTDEVEVGEAGNFREVCLSESVHAARVVDEDDGVNFRTLAWPPGRHKGGGFRVEAVDDDGNAMSDELVMPFRDKSPLDGS